MVYVVGLVENEILKQLWFVDGACYAAGLDVYEQVFARIYNAVHKAEQVTFMQSRELARLIKIDPLERNVLQIQGMGEIQSPNKVFQSLVGQKPTENFQVLAILHESKYQQTLNSDPSLKNEMDRLHIQSTPAQILDPNNKAKIFNIHVVQYEANHA